MNVAGVVVTSGRAVAVVKLNVVPVVVPWEFVATAR